VFGSPACFDLLVVRSSRLMDDDDPAWEVLRELEEGVFRGPAPDDPQVPVALLNAPAVPHPLPALDTETLRSALAVLLPGKDLSSTSLGQMRADLEGHFGLEAGHLNERKDEIDSLIKAMLESPAEPHEEEEVDGEEKADASRAVYNVTLPAPKTARAADGTVLKAPRSYTQKQLVQAMLDAVQKTQGPRLAPLRLKLMADFREKHANGMIHDHLAVLAEHAFRFGPLKKVLLRDYGLATHWSCTHEGYASCIAYGYVPSKKKPLSELDPKPELWAAVGEHPPLSEASRPPVTAKALAKLREKKRLHKAEHGKREPKFEDIDLWPVVISQNIFDGPRAPEVLMAYAKRCGGAAMTKFCFRNWPKLPELISRCWQVEKVEQHVAQAGKTRMQVLRDATGNPCTCKGQWMLLAKDILEKNNIPVQAWTAAMLHSLQYGRSKGTLVCHAGYVGNEGKSFLYGGLEKVYGEENVFTTPSKGGFPLLGLERCRLALLDDWRFNEDLMAYPLQLLWFEGKPIVIARPQNQHSGHLKYSQDDPIFISTLMGDIHKVKGKKIEGGDIAMMLKRLKIFEFHHELVNPTKQEACARCFAELLLGVGSPSPGVPVSQQHAPGVPVRQQHGEKRGPTGPTGSTPERKKPCSWSVDEVCDFLTVLSLGHVEQAFRTNGVDGMLLSTLSAEELEAELGLTKLQARKILTRLPQQ
jgi:hypothetical protein